MDLPVSRVPAGSLVAFVIGCQCIALFIESLASFRMRLNRLGMIVGRAKRVAAYQWSEVMDRFHREGFVAAVRYSFGVGRAILREKFGSRRRKTNSLDASFGTDTAENVKLHQLDIQSPNSVYGVYYRATDMPILHRILGSLQLEHPEYSFVDYGSGKGLVLMEAAAYPFRKVIGVEFARELHETAQQNLLRHPAHLRRAGVELYHGDAVEFPVPDGNLVLYFYEPFEAPVLAMVIARIRPALKGRNVVVVHIRSRNTKAMGDTKLLWDAEPGLKAAVEGTDWTIYRSCE